MKLRFAPSPTGFLHVGNARIAVTNALLALKHGGEVFLRLDDTDLERSRAEYATAIEEDLAWLGISFTGPVRQQDRVALYDQAAAKLKASGHLYPCFESEEELRFKREQRAKQGKPPVYDRAALKMTQEQLERALANGKSPYWRFKLSQGSREWNDGVLGARSVKLPPISDPVLIRADGSFLYTFTSVVDDIDMAITHIVRGEDHVTNTGVQLDIFVALGADTSRLHFAHLPLLTDADGGPLSKRLGGLGLRQMRRDGVEPAALVGYLAALGTSHDPKPGLPAELAPGFELSAVSKSSARFDPRQMLALNRKLLHEMDFATAKPRLPEAANEHFWGVVRGNLDMMSEARLWWEVAQGHIAPVPQEGEGAFLKAALDTLPPEPFTPMTWPDWTNAVKAATGRKGKALFMPLRLALTGEDHGPDLKDLLPLIGRSRAEERLRAAIQA